MDAEEIRKNLIEQASKLPAEQADELKKKIEAMNEEELMAVVKSQSCLFCEIIAGRIETFKIYESENIIAILDINPVSRGHMIVMPKKHFQFLSQMPNELIYEIFSFVKTISLLLVKVMNSQGVTISIMQGMEQNVPHIAVNIIPRYKDDKLNFLAERQKADKEELERTRLSIRNAVENAINAKINIQKEKEEPRKESKKPIEEKKAEKIEKRMRIP